MSTRRRCTTASAAAVHHRDQRPHRLARVFTGHEISIDALLASACLPHLFQAVEIDGEPYWDGGYTGNPALYPLIYDTEALDLLLVKINPLVRKGTPRRNDDIVDRISEITFNASLIGEMRAIAFVSRLVRRGAPRPGPLQGLASAHDCRRGRARGTRPGKQARREPRVPRTAVRPRPGRRRALARRAPGRRRRTFVARHPAHLPRPAEARSLERPRPSFHNGRLPLPLRGPPAHVRNTPPSASARARTT